MVSPLRLEQDLRKCATVPHYAPTSKIGLTADVPTRYAHVRVTAPQREKKRISVLRTKRKRELDKLKAAKVEFVWGPDVTNHEAIGEVGSLFINDPSGNSLEFKSYRDKSKVL